MTGLGYLDLIVTFYSIYFVIRGAVRNVDAEYVEPRPHVVLVGVMQALL